MLKILPIILSRISPKNVPLFFVLFLYLAYYSTIILNMKQCHCSIRVSKRSIRVYRSFQHFQPVLPAIDYS